MSSTPSLGSQVAGALRAEMARKRLTSKDLAVALNCSQSSASRRMAGATPLDLDELTRIAEWLGVSEWVLLGSDAA